MHRIQLEDPTSGQRSTATDLCTFALNQIRAGTPPGIETAGGILTRTPTRTPPSARNPTPPTTCTKSHTCAAKTPSCAAPLPRSKPLTRTSAPQLPRCLLGLGWIRCVRLFLRKTGTKPKQQCAFAPLRLCVKKRRRRYPLQPTAKRSKVDPAWRQFCTTYAELASGTDYMQRNDRMIALAAAVLAFPLTAQEYLHGAAGLPMQMVPRLDERKHPHE